MQSSEYNGLNRISSNFQTMNRHDEVTFRKDHMCPLIIRKKTDQKRVHELTAILRKLQRFTSVYSPNRTAFKNHADSKIEKTEVTKYSPIVKDVAPRIEFVAKAVMTKNNRYVKGQIINISESGIFIETTTKIFRENEFVKIFINPDGGLGPYTVVAKVIWFGHKNHNMICYGLKFAQLPSQILRY